MQGRGSRVDADVDTYALLGEEPVECLAAAASSQHCILLTGGLTLPSDILDKSTLLKQAQHALLRSCSYLAGVLLPFCLSRDIVWILAGPFLARSLTACEGVLIAYALTTDVLSPLRQMSELQHRRQWLLHKTRLPSRK